MALVSISEASRLTNKSRTTVHRYISKGKLSIPMGHGELIFLRIEMTPLAGRHPGFPGKHHRKIVTIFKATFGRNITD